MRIAIIALAMFVAVAGLAPVASAQLDVAGAWTGKGTCKGIEGSSGDDAKSTETMVEMHFDNRSTGLTPGGHLVSAFSDSDNYSGFMWFAYVIASTKPGSGLVFLSQGLSGPCRNYGGASGYLKVKKNSKMKGTLYYYAFVQNAAACKVSLQFVPGSASGEPMTYCN